jgi:hypothetical protein
LLDTDVGDVPLHFSALSSALTLVLLLADVQVVLAAAEMLPLWQAVGIEIVPGLHESALDTHRSARADTAYRSSFVLGDYADEGGLAERALAGASLVFCFATTWPTGKSPYLPTLSSVLGCRLRRGSVVITVDKQISPDVLGPSGKHFRQVAMITGPNRATGDSNVFVYTLHW